MLGGEVVPLFVASLHAQTHDIFRLFPGTTEVNFLFFIFTIFICKKYHKKIYFKVNHQGRGRQSVNICACDGLHA